MSDQCARELRLHVLGPLEIDAGGPALDAMTSRPRRLALLVYLAVSAPRCYHSRDELVAVFWPEHDEAHGRAALRQALHVLRAALGTNILRVRSDSVGVDRDMLWCDATAFHDAIDAREYAVALSLARGELLPGFHVSNAPAFEQWLDLERARIRSRVALAAWTLSARAEEQGDMRRSIELAWAALRQAPDDEIAVRRLLTIFDRAGDRVGAIRAYNEFAARVGREYGVEPAPETDALAREIRARMSPRNAPTRAGALLEGTS